MLNSILAPVSRFFRRAPVKTPQEKLNEMFQVCNRVRNVHTGRVYTVFEVDFGGAFLMDDYGQTLKASWLSSVGRLRPEVVARWKLDSACTATH